MFFQQERFLIPSGLRWISGSSTKHERRTSISDNP
nr:MAG TPA: hypothetical protein [Caudoviricetes sp.]